MPVSEATLSASPSKPQLHCGIGWPSASRPCMGMWTWPSSPANPGRALHDPAALDDAAAEAGADDRGDRRAPRGVRAEAGVVGVERRGVAVVVVDDGQPEPRLQGAAEIEAAPARVGEVRRALRRDDAVGAGRARACRAPPRARARAASPCAAGCRRRPAARASTAISGPSVTRLGVSTMPSTREPLAGSRTVALFLLPPLSRPTTTQESIRAGL